MKLFNHEKFRRAFSIVTLYAVFIQQIIPFGMAMDVENTFVTTSTRTNIQGASPIEDVEVEEPTKIDESIDFNSEVEQLNQMIMAAPTGGGQSESSGFSIGSSDGMVDKFTGDFSHSIPLMSVEGYPIVISYNSNVIMNQEASWVGLGWDLNVGSISREMRGIPDDFNGEDKIVKTVNQLQDLTWDGWKAGTFVKFGFQNIGVGITGQTHLKSAVFINNPTLDNYLKSSHITFRDSLQNPYI